jgi:hypothetical protein
MLGPLHYESRQQRRKRRRPRQWPVISGIVCILLAFPLAIFFGVGALLCLGALNNPGGLVATWGEVRVLTLWTLASLTLFGLGVFLVVRSHDRD